MFYSNEVRDTRALFFSSWKKYKEKQSLLPLEKQIAAIIIEHPEYHSFLEEGMLNETPYFPEIGQTNPFLHMGLHLAVRDQIATNRPVGIAVIYKTLLKRHGDPLVVEHMLMDHLAECLWLAQRYQTTPDEKKYLRACQQLTNKNNFKSCS
ncbi:DUF1841 family protein [Legionella nagasakiensis]|uniref:DUF1841 family protein n=1 Tax=Legionella nagasakiensis TaxID=535290 RepID=UPI0010553BFA|nr:DUF1841 family protein [Legionella nagasakiensis]